VLFTTAKLFGCHAATVLVTVDKESGADPYFDPTPYLRCELEFFDVAVAALAAASPHPPSPVA
jgi:hypothetical protein